MKKLLILMLAVFVMSPMADAKQVGKVTLPDYLTAGKDELLLNGAGFRKKVFIKVYAAGLYLKEKQTDPQIIMDADTPMAIRMHFVHSEVSSKKLVDAWNDGFVNGTGGNIAPIKTEIDTFNSFFFQKAKKNDIYDIIYIPEQGVSVYIKGELKGTIKGLDFKKAVFSIWLGEKPADSRLKKGMLGK
ncbi:MAG: chalcone isomerase family protein [Deltaproteobacteria bacterium]|nr:chalcone isomerase family protein [Deltaproteobacteria bacterium]